MGGRCQVPSVSYQVRGLRVRGWLNLSVGRYMMDVYPSPSFMMKGADMSHNRDKEKKEGKKKAQHDLKEKRKLKKEKHQKKSVITLPSQL